MAVLGVVSARARFGLVESTWERINWGAIAVSMNMFQASVTQTKEVSVSTEEKKCSIIFIKEFIYLYKTTVVVARHGGTVT